MGNQRLAIIIFFKIFMILYSQLFPKKVLNTLKFILISLLTSEKPYLSLNKILNKGKHIEQFR